MSTTPVDDTVIDTSEVAAPLEETPSSPATVPTEPAVDLTADASPASNPLEARLTKMLQCGVHFGHQTRRWNPKMKKFIYTSRGGIHILDLMQTITRLDEAKQAVTALAESGKVILFLCTKRQGQDKAAEIARLCDMPFINARWIGGLFTNFKVVFERVKYLNDLREKQATGKLDSMIKKEKGQLLKQMERMEAIFGGLSHMRRLPDMIFIIDPNREQSAIREARAMKIAVMGTLDSNCDPDDVDFGIPANDDAIRSIDFLLDEIGGAIRKGREAWLAKGGQALPVALETQATAFGVAVSSEYELEDAPLDTHARRKQAHVVVSELKPIAPAPVVIEEVEEEEEEIVTTPKKLRKPAAKKAPVAKTSGVIEGKALPSISARIVATLKEEFGDLDELKAADKDALVAIEGIGSKTADKILEDLK